MKPSPRHSSAFCGGPKAAILRRLKMKTLGAPQANIWALRFGICSKNQEASVWANAQNSLLRLDLGFLHVRDAESQNEAHPELFFAHFALQALATRGLHQESLELSRRAWGAQIEGGATTFWEHLAHANQGSRCYAWNCAPQWFLGEEILGIRSISGQSDCFEWRAPNCDLDWARGIYVHRNGPIEVVWGHENGAICVEVSAPECVWVMR